MRKPLQEVKDLNVIREFLASNDFCYLSVMDEGMPYTVPLNFGFTLGGDGKLTICFHTSVGGRLYEIIMKGPQTGVKACIAVARMDGVLRFAKACDWDIVYESFMGEGLLDVVTETKAKVAALHTIMDCYGGGGLTFEEERIRACTIYSVTLTDYRMKKSKKGTEYLNHPDLMQVG